MFTYIGYTHERRSTNLVRAIVSAAIACSIIGLSSCSTADENAEGQHSSRTQDHLRQVCQAVIDSEGMDGYYHVSELPERKPLRIVRNVFVEDEPRLSKFGVPVVFISPLAAEEADVAYLEFTKIQIYSNSARVELRYPVEGIRGNFTLRQEGGNWRIASEDIVEQ